MRRGRLSSRWLVVVFCMAWLPSSLMCAEPCTGFPPPQYATGQLNLECDTAVRSANTIVSPFLVFATVVAITFPVLWLLVAISNRKHLRPGRDRSEPARRVIRERNPAVGDESSATPPRGERGAAANARIE